VPEKAAPVPGHRWSREQIDARREDEVADRSRACRALQSRAVRQSDEE
jgi:hypothetical protein